MYLFQKKWWPFSDLYYLFNIYGASLSHCSEKNKVKKHMEFILILWELSFIWLHKGFWGEIDEVVRYEAQIFITEYCKSLKTILGIHGVLLNENMVFLKTVENGIFF